MYAIRSYYGVCCLSLIKVEEFSGMIKGVLGPMMGDLLLKD